MGWATCYGARGEPVDDLVLRGYVSVSLRRDRSGQARGNLDGVMVVPLPVAVVDPVQRLRLIAAETVERKKLTRPPAGTLLRNGPMQRAFLHVMARQRWANTYVANVPGPPVRLHLAGAPLLEVFPLVPLIGNVTLGVGALSYAGQFNLTVVADEAACPDIEIFTTGIATGLQALEASLPSPEVEAGVGGRPRSFIASRSKQIKSPSTAGRCARNVPGYIRGTERPSTVTTCPAGIAANRHAAQG